MRWWSLCSMVDCTSITYEWKVPYTHCAYTQGCSYQIWSGQVRSVRARTLHPRGVWGHVPPPKKVFAMSLLLRPFWGQYDASRRPDNGVWHEWMSTLSAHCIVYYWWTFVMKNLFPPQILSPWTKYLVPPDWIFQNWIWNIQSPSLKHLVPCIK